MAVTQGFLEWRVQLLRLDFPLFEIDRHQVLVHFHDLIDQRAVDFLDRREIRLATRTEEAVGDRAAAGSGKIDRQALLAESLLNLAQQRRQIDVVAVDLVDDDDAAQPAPGGGLHHPHGHQFDAVLRVDDDRRGLHRRQRGQRLAEEIRVARRVEQVDARIAEAEMGAGELDRMPVRLLQRVVVAHGGAAFDRAGTADRPGSCHQCFDQCGFPAATVAHQGHGANILGTMPGHDLSVD